MHSSLISKDLRYVWHPFTPQKDSPEPLVITGGKGVYLYDEQGKSYIDAISSWWVNLHGHAHPYIAEKIYEQAKKLEHVIFAGFTHEPAIHLAERLINILPGNFSKIFYSDNGSTAVEVAIKMAIQYWWNISKYEVRSTKDGGSSQLPVASRQSAVDSQSSISRNKILAFNNGYHGDTFGAMSVSDRGIFTLAFHNMLFEVIFIDPPRDISTFNFQLSTFNPPTHGFGGQSLQPSTRLRTTSAGKAFNLQLSTFNPDEVACFIYEPLIQGAGGMKMYDAVALDNLLKFLKSHNVICIADEVMTGFGRTGKLFASEYMEEKPDIICLSKGLTGGTMALGATACTKKVHDAFLDDNKLKTFFHGHSFTANPLACTAALASLDLLENEQCISAIKMVVESHKVFVDTVASRQSPGGRKLKSIRQLGTILAFEIMDGQDEYLNEISKVITEKALAQQVYLRPLGNTVYIMPPYCISSEQLQQVYDTVLTIIEEC